MQNPNNVRMPALFVGHGSPMNALNENSWTRAWQSLGADFPRPAAVVSISAHWYVPETAVTASGQPRTIHDFGGFPDALYELQYPAPGAPALASRVAELFGSTPVRLDEGWGLDHGTWSVLLHVFPRADVPVVQLSIDKTKPARWHYEIAQKLRPLRDEGVLVLGSGNIVHNLKAYSWGRYETAPYDWAVRFEAMVRQRLVEGDFDPLIAYESLGRDATLAAPTPEHYLPLLYVIAQHGQGEPIAFPVEGFDGGSISMLSVRVG